VIHFTSTATRAADAWVALSPWELATWTPRLTPAQSAPCPACSGTTYLWEAARPDEVACRRCGRVSHYDAADTQSIFSTNGAIRDFRFSYAWRGLEMVRRAYQETKERRYAETARKMVMQFAAVWPGWRIHKLGRFYDHPRSSLGKLKGWSKYDALAFGLAADVFREMRRAGAFSEADQRVFERFLRDGVAFLQTGLQDWWATLARFGIGQVFNGDAFVLHGIARMGRALDDPALMRWCEAQVSFLLDPKSEVFSRDGRYHESLGYGLQPSSTTPTPAAASPSSSWNRWPPSTATPMRVATWIPSTAPRPPTADHRRTPQGPRPNPTPSAPRPTPNTRTPERPNARTPERFGALLLRATECEPPRRGLGGAAGGGAGGDADGCSHGLWAALPGMGTWTR
jgi:hypothetical protein